MLYKFQSRATPDLLMLEPQGRRILKLIGKFSEDRRGILRSVDMPAAITALEAAIEDEEQEKREIAEARADETENDKPDEPVSLRQRAAPFIEMMRRCMAAEKDIVWGV